MPSLNTRAVIFFGTILLFGVSHVRAGSITTSVQVSADSGVVTNSDGPHPDSSTASLPNTGGGGMASGTAKITVQDALNHGAGALHLSASASILANASTVLGADPDTGAMAIATWDDTIGDPFGRGLGTEVVTLAIHGQITSSLPSASHDLAGLLFNARLGDNGTQVVKSYNLDTNPKGIIDDAIVLTDSNETDLASRFLELNYQADAHASAEVPGFGGEIQSTGVDFSNTIEVTNISLYDTSGNLIPDPVVTSELGAQYPGTVPEPNGIWALAPLVFACLLRRGAAFRSVSCC